MKVAKYSGAGNDFILIIGKGKTDRSQLAQKLCHRHNGIGADGLVVLLPHETYDFEWEFYNADGSTAAMCGNASRCVAHYAHELGISKEGKAAFLTGAGVIRATINGDYIVSDMTEPHMLNTTIEEDGESWWLIDTGVPHLVVIRESVEVFDIEQARILRHKYNANVNICSMKDGILYVRTYERGVEDETLACGTGMVACYVRYFMQGNVEKEVKVYPSSGEELYVSYDKNKFRFGGKVIKILEGESFIS
jgi:diaminopimelate epimerase